MSILGVHISDFSAVFVLRDCVHDVNRLLYPGLYLAYFSKEHLAERVLTSLNNQSLVRLMPRYIRSV